MSFSWIPFYKELAEKLLEYKDNREKLVSFIYSQEGLEQFSNALHLSDKTQRIDDIDPFSFFGLFNSGKKKTETRIAILERIKFFFNISATIPSDFDGIPVLNYARSFFYDWNDLHTSCESLWNCFIDFINNNSSERYINYINIKRRPAESTMPLFWIRPDEYVALDSNNREYLKKNGIDTENIECYDEYIDFLNQLKKKIENNEINEKKLMDISYNAWCSEKDNKNYWLIAPGENARLWEDFYTKGIIGIGWDNLGDYSRYKKNKDSFIKDFLNYYGEDKKRSATQVWRFYKDIKEGDVIFVKNGLYSIIGLGEIISGYYYEETREEYKSLRDVEWIKTGKWDYPGQAPQDTVTLLKKEKAEEIINTMYNQDHKNTISLMKLFIENKNIILHGAPGTGKTYMAKEIAKEMNAEVAFVQFHPSYDYTDFVEGLRPVKNENDTTVTFEKIDGIFKQFCEKALLSASVKGGTDNFEESFSLLLEKIEKENYVEVETMTKSSRFKVELNEYENGLTTRTYPNDEYKKGEWLPGHSRFYTKEQLYNIYRGLPGVPKGGHDNYRKAIIKYMKDNLQLKDYVPGTTEKQDKKFVFIIDEINRGELSKIFGELFYSIDPGYRIDISQLDREILPVTIKTQYSNMQNEPNEFDIVLGEQEDFGHFFIPDNVYIIGTMNDIDRSVESMDFAFRRRFTFKEITAEDTQESILTELDETIRTEAIKRMNSLNNKIWHKPTENEAYEDQSIEGLSSAYHIGGAYFLKLKELNYDFDKLWEYHLSGLLREYLRGMEDAEELLEKLHKAYNLESQE